MGCLKCHLCQRPRCQICQGCRRKGRCWSRACFQFGSKAASESILTHDLVFSHCSFCKICKQPDCKICQNCKENSEKGGNRTLFKTCAQRMCIGAHVGVVSGAAVQRKFRGGRWSDCRDLIAHSKNQKRGANEKIIVLLPSKKHFSPASIKDGVIFADHEPKSLPGLPEGSFQLTPGAKNGRFYSREMAEKNRDYLAPEVYRCFNFESDE